MEQGIENEIRLWSDFIFGRGSLLWTQTSSTVSDDLLRTRSRILPLSWVGDKINWRSSFCRQSRRKDWKLAFHNWDY